MNWKFGWNTGDISSKLTLGPFLTRSVRNEQKIERLGVWDPDPYPELKIDIKNYNQHFIKHDVDNNSHF